MAYSDDAVKAKLAALNETQDSIVSNAQWIMFHRRNADRTASLWLNRLQDNTNPAKRLNLIYLANEVVQQSRARSKQDFLLAFEPLIADATYAAYKGSSQDIQGKLRRVVEVWRQRGIFDARIQEQVEKGLDELDRQKPGKSLGGGGARLGGSLFGGSATASGVVPELEATNKAFTALTKADAAARAPVRTADSEYEKWNDPSAAVPSAPMHAARLRGLVKDLTAAHNAVGARMKVQRDIIESLEKLLQDNRTKLAEDEAISSALGDKIDSMQARVTEVEDSIMQRQGAPSGTNGEGYDDADPARPETESFTPPPPDTEAFTPPPADSYGMNGESALEEQYTSTTGADLIQEQPQNFNEPAPAFEPSASLAQQEAAAAAQDFLKNLMPQIRQMSGDMSTPAAAAASSNDPRLKKRKYGHNPDMDEEIFGAGSVGGVDEDGVSALLGQ